MNQNKSTHSIELELSMQDIHNKIEKELKLDWKL